MLILEDNSPEELFKKTFLAVYHLDDSKEDPENYKDTSAALTLKEYCQEDGVGLKKEGFYSSFDYDKYIFKGNEQMHIEVDHYNGEIVNSGKLEALLKYFKANPKGRRGLINLWTNHTFDPQKPFPCLVYVWFRKQGNVLNMNCHMRANNAYKILLMDLHIGTSMHEYVAKELGLKKGIYNHFVDSLHYYKHEKKDIDSLYNKLTK